MSTDLTRNPDDIPSGETDYGTQLEVVFASDGHREILETIKAPVRDEHGRLQGVLGIGRNITRRRQTESMPPQSR